MTLTDKILYESSLSYEKRLIKESTIHDSIHGMIANLKSTLSEQYQKSLNASRAKLLKSTEKIKQTIQKVNELKKIKDETINLKELAHAGLKWSLAGFPKEMEDKIKNHPLVNNDDLSESLLLEVNFSHILKKIVEKVRKYFPFNLLEHFSEKIEGFTRKGLNALSLFLVRVKALQEPFYFEVIPMIVGSTTEMVSENLSEVILGLIPGVGIVLNIISILSYGLTLASIIATILKDLEAGFEADMQTAEQEI